jgi:hypothetical protein
MTTLNWIRIHLNCHLQDQQGSHDVSSSEKTNSAFLPFPLYFSAFSLPVSLIQGKCTACALAWSSQDGWQINKHLCSFSERPEWINETCLCFTKKNWSATFKSFQLINLGVAALPNGNSCGNSLNKNQIILNWYRNSS